jgi:hypothetical protein
MVNRSKAEVVFAAHWLSMLGDLSMRTLKDALTRGDEMDRVDAVYSTPGMPAHAVEYDDGFWHGESSVGRDVRKTERMLQPLPSFPGLLVARIRLCAIKLVGAPRDDRLFIVHVESRHPGKAVRALAVKLAGHHSVPGSMKEKLLSATGDWDADADAVAHHFFMETDEEYKLSVQRMVEEVGEAGARRVLNAHGVKSRIDESYATTA